MEILGTVHGKVCVARNIRFNRRSFAGSAVVTCGESRRSIRWPFELMYHATDIPGDPDNMGAALSHWARYFGISTLQPKTPAVLHTLADSCMRSDEHNNLCSALRGA